jgi:CubicO group peptidase (beta-lactamase class C family)
MRIKALLAGLLGSALLLVGPASTQPATALKPPTALKPAAAAGPTAPGPVTPSVTHPLDAQDVDTWLDGYMPYALHSGDIAGAVVVVVKDGKVLTERGYGYADVKTQKPVDPEATLFRPGSVSKLFTWTAVMQLVEQGKLDLDKDVNGYLDFKIPPKDGKPVTLRNLMTHTPGFEERAKRLFVADKSRLTPLKGYLVNPPAVIYPVGEVPAYSNYGATLAGYIVERVSGEPFDDYVAHHIFQPLGMAHSTFDQPLPANLSPDMASGYFIASQPAKPFEFVNARPAGSVSATGADMARFMIAHLQDGRYGDAQILKPETARLMHTTTFTPVPPLPGMALGFYHEDRNGQVIIGHAGDTQWFHSELHLYLNDGVGLFVSMNSLGKAGAAGPVRSQLFRGFTDRYFPAAPANLPTVSTAKHDAALMAGRYINSRGSDTNFLILASLLGQATVKADPDGLVEVSAFKTVGGAVKKWREVGPMVWQEVNGESRMAATMKNGRVATILNDDEPPVFVLMPVPAKLNAAWAMPLLFGSIGVLALCVVLWPISILVRRRYGQAFALSGRAAMLYRLVRVAAIVDLILVAGWLALFSMLGTAIGLLDDPIDPWLRLLQVLGVLAILGAVVGVWNLVTVWRDGARSWWAKVSSLMLAIALLSAVWFILTLHLITASLQF